MMTSWTVNLYEDNRPLLEALSLRIPAAPRAFLKQLCKKQRVFIDDSLATADTLVFAGQRIVINNSLRLEQCLLASQIAPRQILHEDQHCLVINKPAGLAVHHAHGHTDDLQLHVQAFLKLRGNNFRTAPVHRLDIGTSGPVLFGKGRAAISQLGQMLMANQAEKHYLALVQGETPQEGELSSAVPAKGKSKESRTRYRRLACSGLYSLLELELVTGRRHQIRYQLAEAGWPIVGDQRYNGPLVDRLDRPFLHCHQLSFPQPETEQPLHISCEPPDDLKQLLTTLGMVIPSNVENR